MRAAIVRGFRGRVSTVAVCGEQFREYTADDGPEEGETGADERDVAFGCCPVGRIDVAVCEMLGLGDWLDGETYMMYRCFGRRS